MAAIHHHQNCKATLSQIVPESAEKRASGRGERRLERHNEENEGPDQGGSRAAEGGGAEVAGEVCHLGLVARPHSLLEHEQAEQGGGKLGDPSEVSQHAN